MRANQFIIEVQVDEDWKDWAVAGATAAGMMGAPQAASKQQTPTQPAAQQTVKAPTKAPTTLVAKAPTAKTVAKEPSQPIDLLSKKHTHIEEILHRAARAAGLKGAELAQFLAQCAHESSDFARLKERSNTKNPTDYFTKKYDPKFAPNTASILGNTKPGDGAKYFGRGYIQLTGRDNYRQAQDGLAKMGIKLPLLAKPELAAVPQNAAKIAVWYWNDRVKPFVNNFNDTVAVTKKINPAMQGLQDRQDTFADYKNVLGT